MEMFIGNILNKFNRPLTPIKDYNTIYEYQGVKYIVNTIDYIYIFLQTLLNVSMTYRKYSSVIDSIYSDILKIKKDIFTDYSQTIIIDKNYFIIQKDISFSVLKNKKINKEFKTFVDNILNNVFTNKNIKIYILSCTVKYKLGSHSEFIIFQIYNNELYIINYDPQGINISTTIMGKFLKYLTEISENYLVENKINIHIKTVYKENLQFEYQGKKIGGLQNLTNNFYFLTENYKPNYGLCLLYSFFMIYFLINILYFYSDISCYEAIPKIENIIYNIFKKDRDQFASIFINFGNHILNRYYEYSFFQIETTYGYFEKIKAQKQINEIFEFLFKNVYLPKNLKKQQEILDFDFLKSSGYSCKEDIECGSDNCVNNHCYIDEKEVNIDDIRSVGNPCLYNIQCKSGNCRDYVCIGEDKHEKENNPQYYNEEDNYQPLNYEDEILDLENTSKYMRM